MPGPAQAPGGLGRRADIWVVDPVVPVSVSQGRLGRGYLNPIVRNGGAGGTSRQIDDIKVGPGICLWFGGTDYRMWREGIDSSLDPDGAGPNLYNAVVYDTSNDGTNWTTVGRVQSPAASPSWENSENCPNDIIWDPLLSVWRQLYHGGNSSPSDGRKIGFSESPDLTGGGTWTKSGANPILGPGASGAWDDGFISDLKIIKLGGGLEPAIFSGVMAAIYIGRAAGGGPGKVGLAWSSDYGQTWSKDPNNPILTNGAGGQWDETEIMAACLIYESGVFRGWYVGRSSGSNVNGLGYVWGTRLDQLQKSPLNPILSDGTPTSFSDSINVYRDAKRLRIQHGTYDFGTSPPIRGKAEAFERPGSVYFNGTSSRVDVSDETEFDFERTSPFSLSAWIYLERIASGIVIAKQQNGGGFPGYNLGLQTAGQLVVDLRAATGGGAFQRRGNTVLSTTTWYHVCGTFDGSNTLAGIQIYLNGVLESMTDLDTNLTASILNNVELQVGARGGSGAPVFYFPGGRIAEAMVWNDDLTPTEVATLYSGGPIPRQDALLLWLPLDDPNELVTDRAA